jgi:hypothetical protein
MAADSAAAAKSFATFLIIDATFRSRMYADAVQRACHPDLRKPVCLGGAFAAVLAPNEAGAHNK